MTVLAIEPTIECTNEVLRDVFHWQQFTHSDSVKFMHNETDRILAVVACWNSWTCWGSTRYHAYVPPKENSQSFNTRQDAMNYVEILAMLGDI